MTLCINAATLDRNPSATVWMAEARRCVRCIKAASVVRCAVGNVWPSRMNADTRTLTYKSITANRAVSYQRDYSEGLYERGPACGNTDAPLWLRPHPRFLLPALFLSFGGDSSGLPWQRKREVAAA